MLLKLYAQDIGTMCRIMLDFSQNGENLLNIDLNDDAKAKVVSVFSQINKHALQHLNEKKVTVLQFLKYMGYSESMIRGQTMTSSSPGGSPTNVLENPDEKNEEANDGFGSDLNAIYT